MSQTQTQILIQILTVTALATLLGTIGLQVTWHQVKRALKGCRFMAILAANFAVIPALNVGVAIGLGVSNQVAIAMILLAAAPFAPVVPIFARMARADLALSAGLTSIYPILSVLLTPLAAKGALALFSPAEPIRLNLWTSLGVLVATITLPLAAGVFIHHRNPHLARILLKPIDVLGSAAGAVSLALVTITEWPSIVGVGGRAWLAMAITFESALVIGWLLGGPSTGARRVVAMGTSNRNIALALLIALQSFGGTAVVSAVVGNGLLLIGMGLVHVAWWRFVRPDRPAVSPAASS
jgi:BASS family bile acid:Na+ symporter